MSQPNESNWYFEEYDGVDEALQEAEKHRRTPHRIWLKAGYERSVVFVDDKGFSIWEHQLVLSGDSRNWVTCVTYGGKICPLCELKIPRYYHTFLTVINTVGNFDSKGAWQE